MQVWLKSVWQPSLARSNRKQRCQDWEEEQRDPFADPPGRSEPGLG